MAINSLVVLDLWQRPENSFAPLSQKQLDFINKLESICDPNKIEVKLKF